MVDIRLIPRTECLKDTVARVLPYWYDTIVPEIKVDILLLFTNVIYGILNLHIMLIILLSVPLLLIDCSVIFIFTYSVVLVLVLEIFSSCSFVFRFHYFSFWFPFYFSSYVLVLV